MRRPVTLGPVPRLLPALAVDELLAQTRRAAGGTRVDDQAVAEAQAEYDEATRGLTEVC